MPIPAEFSYTERADFGATASDFTYRTVGGLVRVAPGSLTFYDAQTGGNKHTDLLFNGSPVTEIQVGTNGQIPVFQGPAGVVTMWAEDGDEATERIQIVAMAEITARAASSAEEAWVATETAESAAAAALAVGATTAAQVSDAITNDTGTQAALAARTLPKAPAISAGASDVVTAPSAQIGAGSDAVTVFGGSTSNPHVLDPGSSLTSMGGGYDNHNGTWPGASAAAIMSVINGAHQVVDALDGHGTIGGGSYLSVHGAYGTIAGGTLSVIGGHYGALIGGRNNCAGATSRATVVTAAISVGASSFTISAVSGKALVNGVTLFIDYGTRSETFINVTVSGSTITLPAGKTFVRTHAIGAVCYFSDDTATDATVGGGQSNNALALQATVAGGFNGLARGTGATVGGGVSNIAGGSAAPHATIGGGTQNVASGNASTIAGGTGGLANGANSAVAGGSTNAASGIGASVQGGANNTANASYASTVGQQALADHYGERAFASGNFAAQGDAQGSDLIARAAITGSGSGELFLDQTTARLTLADNVGYRFTIETIAKARTSSTTRPGEIVGVWTTTGSVYRKTGAATTTLFGTPVTTADAANIAGANFAVAADTTNGALGLTGTGIASHSLFFVSRIRLVKVAG